MFKQTKGLLYPVLLQILLYFVQFIFIPSIYYISPYDIMRSFALLIITVCSITTLGMKMVSSNLGGWLLGLGVYTFLVIGYHPNNLYGIGNGMFDFDIIAISIIIILTLVLQLLIWIILGVYAKWSKRK